jgi:hypothetical protein
MDLRLVRVEVEVANTEKEQSLLWGFMNEQPSSFDDDDGRPLRGGV